MKRLPERLMLIVLASFAAVSALAGGYGVASTNGLGMPMAWLKTTPFADYVVPGLILGLVVGGSALLATMLLVIRHPWGYVASFGAGAIMLGWIIGEILLIQQFSWLHVVYALNGVLLMVLAARLEFEVYRHTYTVLPSTSEGKSS